MPNHTMLPCAVLCHVVLRCSIVLKPQVRQGCSLVLECAAGILFPPMTVHSGDATAAAVKKKPARSRKKAAPAAVKEEPSMSETSEEEVHVKGQDSVKKVAKPRRRKFDNELTVRLLAAAKAALAAPETGELCL